MQKYAWIAVSPDGQTRKGSIEAVDARSVTHWLTQEGFTVISISKVKWPPTNMHVETVTRRDVIHLRRIQFRSATPGKALRTSRGVR